MSPIRFALSSLACAAVLIGSSASAEDLCAKVDALILSGQQDVSFADVFKPRPGELRNDNVYTGEALLGLFTKCTVQDMIDDVGRGNTTLNCTLDESENARVTEASRITFVANEFARFQQIAACIKAKEGWVSYGALEQGKFNAFIETEAQTRLEDAISAEMLIMQFGVPPLYSVTLLMNLRTTPRDYR